MRLFRGICGMLQADEGTGVRTGQCTRTRLIMRRMQSSRWAVSLQFRPQKPETLQLCHQPSSLHSRRAPASTAHGIDCQGRRATASTVPQLNVNIVQNIALSSKKLPDSTSNTQEEHVKARRRPGVGATHPRSVRAACWMPPNSIARKR